MGFIKCFIWKSFSDRSAQIVWFRLEILQSWIQSELCHTKKHLRIKIQNAQYRFNPLFKATNSGSKWYSDTTIQTSDGTISFPGKWPPTYMPIGLWWDCSNDTGFVRLMETSFTDPRGGLKHGHTMRKFQKWPNQNWSLPELQLRRGFCMTWIPMDASFTAGEREGQD